MWLQLVGYILYRWIKVYPDSKATDYHSASHLTLEHDSCYFMLQMKLELEKNA